MVNPSTTFSLHPGEVHLWHASLETLMDQTERYRQLLSADEIMRADRFHFPIHQKRFTLARGILRQILSYYLLTKPADLIFSYTKQGKPFIEDLNLTFNLSHSHDMAVYAITQHFPIGVDIEKIEENYNDDVARRYFSEEEYRQLQNLSGRAQVRGFYEIWSRKEAIVKAVGEGLTFSLKSFSVSLSQQEEDIILQPHSHWHLETFSAHPQYTSAYATAQPVKKVFHWKWDEQS